MSNTVQQTLRFNAILTIQLEDTNQLSDFLKAVVLESLPKVESNPQILLSSREAAKLLNISERTLWGFAKSGRILQPIRIGTSVRWNALELRRWADAGCPSHEEWILYKK